MACSVKYKLPNVNIRHNCITLGNFIVNVPKTNNR